MRYKLLLVDDDPILIRALGQILAPMADLRFATNGETALRQARDWRPDLVLLDAEMPGMSGFELCEVMKSDPSLRDLPVMFVTSHCDQEFELKGLELGAVDFVTKPFNEALLKAHVRTQLRIKSMTDELRRCATKDMVTRLPNRARLEETLDQEWRRSQPKGSPLSLLLVEIDHLDLYASRYGHRTTERCLQKLAKALKATCDQPADFLARFDDTTFAMLMPDSTRAQAVLRTQQVINAIEHLALPHETSPTSCHVTATVGMSYFDPAQACWGPSGADHCPAEKQVCAPQHLLACAESALKAACKHGRAQSWYSDSVFDDIHVQACEILPGRYPIAAPALN